MPVVIQPRPFNPRKTATVLVVLAFAFYFYYQREPAYQFWKLGGETMGTQYVVKLLDNRINATRAAELKAEIDALLLEVNRQMSTYVPDSEISRLNAADSTDFMPVSTGFARVARAAVNLCEETGGAFNPTLDHVINAWGFGHEGPGKEPDDRELGEALALVGCDRIEVSADHEIRKTAAGVRLNLNAIAKGWGVDEVARLLTRHGITNYMVEIGGEVFAKGISEKLRTWRIGIDRPVDGSLPGEAIDLVVVLDGRGLATSGDYRNFHADNQGRKISHLLDPRTGRPATTSLASVSVIAPDCMTADAVATALYVMGPEEGLAWVDRRPEIEAVFISHGADGKPHTVFSRNFEAYVLGTD